MKKLLLFSALLFLFWQPPMVAKYNFVFAQDNGSEKADFDDEDSFEDPFADENEEDNKIADPLESFNRAVFKFNDFVYTKLLIPTAKQYKKAVPEKARKHLKNFFKNLLEPRVIINAALRGKAKESILETKRFILNSTLGLFGFFDVAKSHWGLKQYKEDTGKTLAHYGVGEGFYIVLPFLGPSNLRDSIGLLGDGYLHPAFLKLKLKEFMVYSSIETTNKTSFNPDEYTNLKKDFLDPYVGFRNAYVQYRRNQIKKEE